MKRIISSLTILILFGYWSLPCLAVEALPGEVQSGGSIVSADSIVDIITAVREWVAHDTPIIENKLLSLVNENVCRYNPTTERRHHFVEQHTEVGGQYGKFYICEYCGKSAGEVLEEAETEYVATLPADNINSSGGFIWRPTVEDFYNYYTDSSFYIRVYNGGSNYPALYKPNFSCHYSSNGRDYFDCIMLDDKRSFSCLTTFEMVSLRAGFYGNLDFKAPVTGTYYLTGNLCDIGNQKYSQLLIGNVSEFALIRVGSSYIYKDNVSNGSLISSWLLYLPSFLVAPFTSYDVTSTNTSDTYNIGTRASSITGNYGIVNGSGNVEQIETQNIVNETNNTYYSPSTGEMQEFSTWSYDYSNRSYNLTTEEGDTITVTYGDEYLTINEGATTTNIYYITEVSDSGDSGNGGEGGGGSDTPAHTHSYTSEVTTEPTCTRSGVRTYTCSCGVSYTEAIPATGHAWEVVNQQFAQYSSSDGTLMQAGFTVYECSVCGQQYRTDDESLPPGIIGQDLELEEVSNQALSLIPQLKPMYQGYLGLLQDTFPYLPDEIMQLMILGVSAAVLIGIWKAIRG